MLDIADDEIKKTFRRINSKISSLNFQTGKVIPKKLGIFLPLMIELRLLFLSPLIIIARDREGKDLKQVKHNILPQEFEKIRTLFLKEKNFPVGGGDKSKAIIGIPLSLFGEKFLDDNGKNRWWNCNLNYVDYALVIRLDSGTCRECKENSCLTRDGKCLYVWIFGTRKSHPVTLYRCGKIGEKWERHLDKNHTDTLLLNRKFPFLLDLKFPQCLIDIEKWSKYSKLCLKEEFCKLMKEHGKEIFLNEKEENDTSDLRKELFPLSKYNDYFLKKYQCLEKTITPSAFLEGVNKAPFFKVIYDFFNDIKKRAEEIFKSYAERLSLNFVATDSELIRCQIFPKGTVTEDTDFKKFIKYFNWKGYYYVHYQGLSEYVNLTNHPEFLSKLVIINEKDEMWTSDIRIPSHVTDLLKMLGVYLKNSISYETFQIPCVYDYLDIFTNKKDRKIFCKSLAEGLKEIMEQGKVSENMKGEISENMKENMAKILNANKEPLSKQIKECIEDKETLSKQIKVCLKDLNRYYRAPTFLDRLLEKEEHCEKENIDYLIEPSPYPVYNFSFNSTSLSENNNNLVGLRKFFQVCNEIAFETFLAAGFVQREQYELFKALLFEEATDSFKKAMEFPLTG